MEIKDNVYALLYAILCSNDYKAPDEQIEKEIDQAIEYYKLMPRLKTSIEKFSKLEMEDIIYLRYNVGLRLIDIADKYNVSHMCIWRKLNKAKALRHDIKVKIIKDVKVYEQLFKDL